MKVLSFLFIAIFSSFLCAQDTLSLEQIARYVALDSADAADELGVCKTVFRKACLRHGIKRWPYRKVKSVISMLNNLENLNNPQQIKEQLDEVLEKYYSGLISEGDTLYNKYVTRNTAQSFSKKQIKKRKAQEFERLCADTENFNRKPKNNKPTHEKKFKKMKAESDFQELLEKAQTDSFFREPSPAICVVEQHQDNNQNNDYNSEDEDEWQIITDEEELEQMKNS